MPFRFISSVCVLATSVKFFRFVRPRFSDVWFACFLFWSSTMNTTLVPDSAVKGHSANDWNVHLQDAVVQNLDVGAVFNKEHKSRINSIDFHRSMELLVTASDDDTIHLYNAGAGAHLKTLYSRKYGCQSVAFTHHTNSVLTASNKGDDHAIRYLSLHDNRWLRYFPGHSARVTSLAMSPQNDLFLSAANDKEVRLWDLRINVCQGLLKVPAVPSAVFDQQGLVFAVSADCGVIKLYDMNAYDKGPFDTFVVEDENCSQVPFGCLRFSNDGKRMLAVTEGRLYVIDAFDGSILQRFSTGLPEGGSPLEAAFSPDGRYIASGCADRKVRVWNMAGTELGAWDTHAGIPTCLKWSLTRCMIASACSALALWIPDIRKTAAVGGFGNVGTGGTAY